MSPSSTSTSPRMNSPMGKHIGVLPAQQPPDCTNITGYATSQVRFLVAHGTGDLYFVLHANTGSGLTEAHALTAASGYHGYSVHAALPAGYTDDIGSQGVVGTGKRPDLTLLQLLGTGTQKVEAYKLSAASSYSGWSMHAATDLPQIQYPVWQFSEG